MSFYFWCVNCGDLGERARKVIICPGCDYTSLTELGAGEFKSLRAQKTLPGVENWSGLRRKNKKELVVVTPEVEPEPEPPPQMNEIKGVMG